MKLLIPILTFLVLPSISGAVITTRSHTQESCLKYLIQERLLKEYQEIKSRTRSDWSDYLEHLRSLSIPEESLSKAYFTSWRSRGELWEFEAHDPNGVIYPGYLWAKILTGYVLGEGYFYQCSLWDPNRANTDEILFFLDLYADPSLRDIVDRGYNSSSYSRRGGGSARPIPLGRGGVIWPAGRR